MFVLQSRLSGMFFKNFGLWTAHMAEALHFDSLDHAGHFIQREHVADVALREMPNLLTDFPLGRPFVDRKYRA